MAGKEATIFIIDLGSSMGDCHNGRVESDLDWGMKYVWDKLAQVLQEHKKTTKIGIIGFRTDDTDNILANEGAEGYENISVLHPLGPLNLSDLDSLRRNIQPSETEAGDAISAIILASELIDAGTRIGGGKAGKFTRKIVLLSNGHGSIDDETDDSIAARINEVGGVGCQLVVVGIDFDDDEYGFKEVDKSEVKENTERLLKQLVESCNNNSMLGTAAEVIENLAIPSIKSTRPYSPYKGTLCLGDPEKYKETAMAIDVERYFKTKQAKAVSAKSYVSRMPAQGSAQSSHTLDGDTEMTDGPSNDLVGVKQSTTYTIEDPTAPKGRKEVDPDAMSKGYAYGKTAVYIEENERNITDYETTKGFSIIGFIPSDKYERYFTMEESCVTIAQPVNDKARIALSSLIHALAELESYAVARIVLKDNYSPKLLLLAPSIEPDLECLIDVPLPFAEDMRIYKFPPLDRIVGSQGVAIAKHRYLPSEALDHAMSDYIDKMDLSTFGTNDEGKPVEYMQIDETFAPYVHRVNQAIRQRAIYPDSEIETIAELSTKWSNPPDQLISNAEAELKTLIEIAEVKKVPPKLKSKRGRQTVPPLSGLDVDALLNRDKRVIISRENTIPEFKQMLASSTEDAKIIDAAKQMGKIIRTQISESTGESGTEQAFANMRVFRSEMIDYEEPKLYNDFLKDLKEKIVKQQLVDGERDFWYHFKTARLGLIDQTALDISEVTEEEANEFLEIKWSELPDRTR